MYTIAARFEVGYLYFDSYVIRALAQGSNFTSGDMTFLSLISIPLVNKTSTRLGRIADFGLRFQICVQFKIDGIFITSAQTRRGPFSSNSNVPEKTTNRKTRAARFANFRGNEWI